MVAVMLCACAGLPPTLATPVFAAPEGAVSMQLAMGPNPGGRLGEDMPFKGWKFFLGRFTFVRHNLILSIAYLKAVRHCSALYADAYSTDIRRLWGRVL